MPFNPINKAPGVYLEEVQVPGPIAGVGTSTAAFIGPAEKGPLTIPTFLTNLTQFQNAFGGYITAPMVYVTHAVRGFFDNGGTSCYFVRVGTAVRASRTLNDRGTPTARPALVVTAKEEGVTGNAITVEVQDASIVATVAVVRAQATLSAASNNQATVTAAGDAANFRPGDTVFLEQGGTNERTTIASISGTTITFQANLSNTYSGGTIRIANLIPGQTQIRIGTTTGIEPGSYVSIAQGATTEARVVQSVERVNHFITLASGLTNTYTMASTDAAVNLQTLEFTLIITTPGLGAENFPNLAMDPRHSRYFAKVVNSASVEVALVDPPNPTLPPDNRPAVIAAPVLTGGQDDDLSQIQPTHYKSAIDALERVDDVNLLCVPDRTDQEIQAYMIAHCEKMQDRFAILDPLPNATPSNGLLTQRNNLSSDNGYAALYYPWIYIANPVASGRIKVPPSGHVAGVYARTDGTRGVHKAPANEPIRGVLELERTLTDEEQGPVNENGINVLRFFPGSGFRVWGARTIAPRDRTQWRYVNVRRLMLFIEESIQEGTQFAVFEPNELGLWEKVKRQVTDFLTRVWRDGALFGASPEEAFRVRVDEELNPPSVRALGQLIIEVVVFPTTPAEFVVFRIIQEPGGPTVEE
ncbi:MAG: phage tail sheath subtilisin-like domain-containing protein [candidate division KSB1 bacterium]|nr:phage tail sheath subtilisin-like domain-containing protein [candidate division KSB1 bacterium]MDZ7273992.1 phage tail sheath subtilisin-like domain-containing protein [candidate division KSB1 bacterium]MDZ7286365.1 phage tail sheath subtilisin-like domain-containing protein [candidate division KSB1 bacterium]MDZ7296593.1 phage tail sheath subtilisin-like domain-containing protein [candidate division KSB1 bacterium]MDZ7309074.1 phage tail sheath subtilisin-like domain-containing protein [can